MPGAAISSEFSEEERQLAAQVAEQVVSRRLTPAALLFLESVRPMNFLGSTVLHFLNPLLSVVLPFRKLDAFASFVEKRGSIELVVAEIERRDSAARETA